MANFPQHFACGLLVSCTCSALGYWHIGLNEVQSAAACILGTLSSLAPDLDHPEGIPGKILSEILLALTPIALFCCAMSPDVRYDIGQLHVEHWIVIFCIAHLFVKYASTFLLGYMTSHRGILHSIPAVVICGEVVFLLFPHLVPVKRLAIAGIAAFGYLTHLVTDEIYGLDWTKLEAKKSLGSALDFGHIKSLSTWIAYIVILVLGVFLWCQMYPGTNPFVQYLSKIR